MILIIDINQSMTHIEKYRNWFVFWLEIWNLPCSRNFNRHFEMFVSVKFLLRSIHGLGFKSAHLTVFKSVESGGHKKKKPGREAGVHGDVLIYFHSKSDNCRISLQDG